MQRTRNNEVCGLVAGLFQAIEEELKKNPKSQRQDYALRCLAEIYDQFQERHHAACMAENALQELAEKAEASRHRLKEAHVDFGGIWEPTK